MRGAAACEGVPEAGRRGSGGVAGLAPAPVRPSDESPCCVRVVLLAIARPFPFFVLPGRAGRAIGCLAANSPSGVVGRHSCTPGCERHGRAFVLVLVTPFQPKPWVVRSDRVSASRRLPHARLGSTFLPSRRLRVRARVCPESIARRIPGGREREATRLGPALAAQLEPVSRHRPTSPSEGRRGPAPVARLSGAVRQRRRNSRHRLILRGDQVRRAGEDPAHGRPARSRLRRAVGRKLSALPCVPSRGRC